MTKNSVTFKTNQYFTTVPRDSNHVVSLGNEFLLWRLSWALLVLHFRPKPIEVLPRYGWVIPETMAWCLAWIDQPKSHNINKTTRPGFWRLTAGWWNRWQGEPAQAGQTWHTKQWKVSEKPLYSSSPPSWQSHSRTRFSVRCFESSKSWEGRWGQ